MVIATNEFQLDSTLVVSMGCLGSYPKLDLFKGPPTSSISSLSINNDNEINLVVFLNSLL